MIPITYRRGSEALVNYPQVDIATGISRTNIYPGTCSGGKLTTMSNVAFYSDDIITEIDYATTPVYQKTFDMEFDLTQTIDGEAIIQIPLFYPAVAGGNVKAHSGFLKVHTDDTTTQLISGASSWYWHDEPGNISGAAVKVISLDFPNTTFKKGEKLRWFVWIQGSARTGVGTDPKNRDPTGDWEGTATHGSPTSTIIQLPFKVFT